MAHFSNLNLLSPLNLSNPVQYPINLQPTFGLPDLGRKGKSLSSHQPGNPRKFSKQQPKGGVIRTEKDFDMNNFQEPDFSVSSFANERAAKTQITNTIINSLQEQFEAINRRVEFIIEDGLKTCQDFSSHSSLERTGKVHKRASSAGKIANNSNPNQPMRSVGSQTDPEPRHQITKLMNTETEIDGSRFTFCQRESIFLPTHQAEPTKKVVQTLPTDQSTEAEAEPTTNKVEEIPLLKHKITLLENKINLYDSVFRSQDEKITSLLDQQAKWEQKSCNCSLVDPMQAIPQRTSVPVKLNAPQQRNQDKKSLFERIEILQQENRCLHDELRKMSQLNKQLQSVKNKEQDTETASKEDKIFSKPLYSPFVTQFEEINSGLTEVNSSQKDFEYQSKLMEQIATMKTRIRHLEDECERFKNINNFLHKTIQENKNI